MLSAPSQIYEHGGDSASQPCVSESSLGSGSQGLTTDQQEAGVAGADGKRARAAHAGWSQTVNEAP